MAICKKCEDEEKYAMAGQGFRDFICALCGRTDTWCNTNVPKFCSRCSEKLDMCQRCGGTLEEQEEIG